MLRRRFGIFAIAAVFATGAAVACSTFTGEPDDVPSSDAASPDAPSSTPDAGPGDATIATDGGTGCDDFDAAPLPTDRMVSCNGTPTDVFADPSSCGWCGHSCGSAACDGTGRCVAELVLDMGSPHQPLIDATDTTSLFFRDGTDVALKVAFSDLAHPITLASKDDDAATATLHQLVPGDRLYVRQYGKLGFIDSNQIMFLSDIGAGGLAAALSTGVIVTEQQSPTAGRVTLFTSQGTIAHQYNGQPGAHDLAVTPDGQRSFWVARGDATQSVPSAMLSESMAGQLMPLGVVALDTFAPNALAADDTTLYVVGPGAAISALSISATQATSTNTLAPGQPARRTAAIAAANGRLYWFASDESTLNQYYHADLYSVSRCGGPVAKHLVAGDPTLLIGGMAVGADYIYWSTRSQIWRVAR